MKTIIYPLLVLLNLSILNAQGSKEITLEEIFIDKIFKDEHLKKGKWLADGKQFAYLMDENSDGYSSIYIQYVDRESERKIVEGNSLADPETGDALKLHDFVFFESGDKVLLKCNAKRIWRKHSAALYYIYTLRDKSIELVYKGGTLIRHAKVSPDDQKVGFVYQNNIYCKDLSTGTIEQVTEDGSEVIINGQFDWVYEEEFGQDDGWRWSPDGTKIVFWRMDQSNIKEFSWTEFEGNYGEVKTIRYPKAGEQNSTVKIGIYNLANKLTIWMDTGKERDTYIPRIKWTKDSDLLSIQRLNRLQNRLDFIMADANTGSSKVIFTETDLCWISVDHDLHFLNNKRQFVWTSERDGYNHVYLYDLKGNLKKQLTSGEMTVKKIYGISPDDAVIYFQAIADKIEEQHLFQVDINEGRLEQLTKKAGTHSAIISPDCEHYIHEFSSVEIPKTAELCNSNESSVRKIIKNNMPVLNDYQLVYPEFIELETSDGVMLKAMITLPHKFDASKKYPVLVYGYGGPGSQVVRNRWGRTYRRMWYNYLAQKGYIIFSLDNRGTGGRGKEFKNLAYGDIGKYMSNDHIEGVKYLTALPYVDKKRIGIWGWSGGGYLTLLCMTKGAEYFKAGLAVAPTTDFRLYNAIWSERYMGLPQKNRASYDSMNILNYINFYKQGLLLVHGAADDNVHMQHSMQFARRLQETGKPFQMMIYPERNHSMLGGEGSVNYHLYSMLTQFLLENL